MQFLLYYYSKNFKKTNIYRKQINLQRTMYYYLIKENKDFLTSHCSKPLNIYHYYFLLTEST